MRGLFFIGKHRAKKFDPRIRPQNSGLKKFASPNPGSNSGSRGAKSPLRKLAPERASTICSKKNETRGNLCTHGSRDLSSNGTGVCRMLKGEHNLQQAGECHPFNPRSFVFWMQIFLLTIGVSCLQLSFLLTNRGNLLTEKRAPWWDA